MAETYEELRKLSDDELIKRYDDRSRNVDLRFTYFLDELHRRRQERHTNQLKMMTWAITGMTVVITIATIVNVVVLI